MFMRSAYLHRVLAVELMADKRLTDPDALEEVRQAAFALQAVGPRHPSRPLIVELIKDDTTWRVMHDKWQKLVDQEEDLSLFVHTLNREGERQC